MSFGKGAPRIPRLTVEDVPALNVFALHRAGALVAGTVTTWQWICPATTLTTQVRAEIARVFISVAGGPENVVQIEYLPQYLGGDRPYFVCPGCTTRRWALHLQGQRIVCRRCCNLDYACRHEWEPALRRAAKLRQRLTDDRKIAARHRRRMIAQLRAAEAVAAAALTAMLAAVERRSKRIRHDRRNHRSGS
jgi:hypothetical protein